MHLENITVGLIEKVFNCLCYQTYCHIYVAISHIVFIDLPSKKELNNLRNIFKFETFIKCQVSVQQLHRKTSSSALCDS